MRNTSINIFFRYLTLFNRYRKKRKVVKDEKEFHGAVNISSLEQHFRKLVLLCEKSGATLLVLMDLTAGQ